jgi:hypothetical protein
MPWARRATLTVPSVHASESTWDMNDYSLGMDTYISNDKFPLMTGQSRKLLGPNMWRLAQDARMPALGEYETRKGFDFYSQAAGETQDQSITAVTGAADVLFSTTTRLAQPFTTSTAGALSRLDLNIKNPSSSATGVVMVCLYSDVSSAPGLLIASTSTNSINITSSNSYVSFYFASAPTLLASTKYWVTVYVQPTGTNSYSWASTTSATTAKLSTDSGASWSTTSYALNFKQYYASASGNKGFIRVYKNDGSKVTYMVHGTTLYTVNDGTGALTAIKTGLSASATNYRFAFANDTLYYVNGYDGYRSYDGTTEKQIRSDNFTLICWHKGLMCLGGGADPNAVIFSNFGVYDTFTSTDFVYAGAPKTGDPPVAFNSLNGYLMITCKNNKYIMSGDDDATFSVDQAPDQKGTYAQETVCQDEEYIYFLSDDGVRKSNGSESQLLSENIYEDVKGISNKAGACIVINRGRLYLWYASATSAVNDKCWVWNLNFSSAVESNDSGAYVSRAFNAYGDNDALLVASSLIGQIHYQENSSNDYNNLGEPLDLILQSPYMTGYVPSMYKSIRYWEPRFGTESGNYTVDCQYAYELRDNWQTRSSINLQGIGPIWGSGITWGSFTWGTTRETQTTLYIPGDYRRIAIRYRHTAARQPVKFLGHTLVVQTRRMR